ncbi:Transglutaminase-like superfamily [Kluyvera cryocrescens]|uniref:Transglutaminase-like superfamily n=1 Tax=Kluyvera cryocrescens TaxID=580 RepID=A0A485A251_KLUCR|nr:Transglutaminase-like superfamily [Kluyvera cryocrescens]
MHRDDAVIGCGTGDVGEILKTGKLGGKCTDINSVFVALCRAVGIPAREMFGIRLGASRKLDKYSKKAFAALMRRAWRKLAAASTAARCSGLPVSAGCRPTRRTSPKCA